MGARMKVWAAVLVALFVGVVAGRLSAAEVRRVTPDHRPYIVEVGDPQAVDRDRLDREMRTNGDLREYVHFYGYPEVAETQEVTADPPWDTYEVRLFYLRRDREVTFGRAFVAPTVNDFGVLKYQGAIRPEDRARFASRAPEMKMARNGVAERVERAAERAAQAAETAEAASMRAVESADRAVAAVDRLEQSFQRRLRK